MYTLVGSTDIRKARDTAMENLETLIDKVRGGGEIYNFKTKGTSVLMHVCTANRTNGEHVERQHTYTNHSAFELLSRVDQNHSFHFRKPRMYRMGRQVFLDTTSIR